MLYQLKVRQVVTISGIPVGTERPKSLKELRNKRMLFLGPLQK